MSLHNDYADDWPSFSYCMQISMYNFTGLMRASNWVLDHGSDLLCVYRENMDSVRIIICNSCQQATIVYLYKLYYSLE